jgi:hypothetical protein
MVRFQRQPPGTAITRSSLVAGALLMPVAAVLIVGQRPEAAAAAAASGILMLVGGHRANHGAGGPLDRMLAELLDRAWDGAVLAPIAWVARDADPPVAIGALVALGGSFLSSYVRARGASLAYSVEESHLTRGIRYGLIAWGLGSGALRASVWAAAGLSVLAAAVRTAQVAREDRG